MGIYLLTQLEVLGQNTGLYRDDGLIASKLTRRQNENMKKDLCQIFQRNGLKKTVNTNMKLVDFLDISFDLNNDLFMPYLKPNNVIMYVNVNSNHPPKIKENIPKSINKRLGTLSKNENGFQESKVMI